MALAGVEPETLVSEPDALTTRPPSCDSFVKIFCFVGVLLLREWVNVCKASSFD